MGIKLVLDDAEQIGPGVWSASLLPEDTQVMGPTATRAGATTVVLLPNLAPPSDHSSELSFEPSHARVLNVGSTTRAIIVFGRETVNDGEDNEVVKPPFGPRVQHDDATFLTDLSSLPNELAEAGKEILNAMRSVHGGYFQRTRVGRFVNRPNNFWTVKIQPRDRSLRFTVRGNPERFRGDRDLKVYPDRHGYSTFKVTKPSQINAVISVLRAAAVP